MRNRFRRINSIFYYTGSLLQILGVVFVCPLVVVAVYWGKHGDGPDTVIAFALPAGLCLLVGWLFHRIFRAEDLDATGAMLMCALGWLYASALGAVPFVIGIDKSYLDGYFEAMSGFTTTGITMFSGLDHMPRSILFWRSLTQWVGGLGIISFFRAVTFRGSGAHNLLGAESHKISAGRPAPGLRNTLKILWGIYVGITIVSTLLLTVQGMSLFDSINHTFTALSTGGFSPHDASIDFYRQQGFANYRLMEYTLIFVMMLGGMNFLIHYRVLTKDFKALWDNIETRYWWYFIAGFTFLIGAEVLIKNEFFMDLARQPGESGFTVFEKVFRDSLFQVVSIITTTGFGTTAIGEFPALSRQFFLIMMVIGGCVGSTGGGIKVFRVAVLNRLTWREIFKLRVPRRASAALVIDGKPVPEDEVYRIAGLFFAWIALLVIGGGVTAALAPDLSPWQAFSGMFSALGNIGPCYIDPNMPALHPTIKITYIIGMLAGRLEILPVLLLFKRRAWM